MSRAERSRRGARAFGLLLAALAAVAGTAPAATAQSPGILSSQISVSGQGATLALDLAGGERLTIGLEDGILRIDGAEAGRFPPAGTLDTSWRALLADALVADVDDLGEVLLAWTPPAGLTGESVAAAEAIRARLAAVFGGGAAAPSVVIAPGEDRRSALDLLFRSGRARQVAAAAEDLPPGEVRVYAGDEVRVEAGDTVDASLLAIESGVELRGTVTGDVVVLGGSLELGPEARVGGSVRTGDASVTGNRSGIEGAFVVLPSESALAEREGAAPGFDFETLNERIRQEVQEATRGVNRALRPGGPTVRAERGVVDRIGRGFAGILSALLTFAILLGVGLGILYFFPKHLDVVARTARTSPGASVLVGAAGIVLAVPVLVVGALFLVASIVGIPALLIWLPGAPAAIALAAVVGYVAVARNVGQWLSASGRRVPWLDRIDTARPSVQIGIGLGLPLAAFAMASVFGMAGPWFDLFRGLLIFVGVVAVIVAGVVGLGAVILSRGGTDPSRAEAIPVPIVEEGIR